MIRTTLVLALGCVLWALPVLAVGAADYLPADTSYDARIPTPESYLGFDVGEWHVRHDQLVGYLKQLAELSPRMKLVRTGTTHEQRPLVILIVSSPGNIEQIDGIRERRTTHPEDGPLVVWQGFSVHGNEASGANASLLLAYHLAAARGDEIDRLLADTVVLIDPSLNPDGLARFAQWANGHHGVAPSADPAARVHHEVWPNGRTNHYWFDLNRDWLLLVHPESRARVAQFHAWRPHVLTDFHEMGSDATYFFQPGVPSRINPLTPEKNMELTRKIGSYHAAALEDLGQLYFTEEVFDDYYYGKGSTYPDVNGAVGILFEQASARGQIIETPHGKLEFSTTIRNQLTTSLSTLRAANELRDELREYQIEFYRLAAEQSSKDPVAGYVIGDGGDPFRAYHLIDLIRRHDIEVYSLAGELTADEQTFEPGHAWVIPTTQRQYLLVQALMERRTEFEDETFYDVSTWTLPLSFNLPSATVARGKLDALRGAAVARLEPPVGRFDPDERAYAYAFDWTSYYAPRALQRLLAADVQAYVTTQPFTSNTSGGRHTFGRGSVVVPAAVNGKTTGLTELFHTIARVDGLDVLVLTGGLTPEGIDLGSPSLRRVEPVKPLLVVGPGVNGYEAGEVWHLLDTRVGLELTMIDTHRFASIDLNDYTELILVNGNYEGFDDDQVDKLRRWIRGGGRLIASKRAAEWSAENLVAPKNAKNGDETDEDEHEGADGKTDEQLTRRYADFRDDRARRRIGGAIFATELDLTHPIGFGYVNEGLPVFRNHTVVLESSDNPYENVASYVDEPLLSGYVGDERLAEIGGSTSLIAGRVGRGSVVLLADDPNFRGIWYGTNRLFLNAIFLSQIIDRTEIDD